MRIAIVADKKTGHLSQCIGLRNIIDEKYKIDKDIFKLNKDIIVFPGFIERAITLIYEKLYLMILKLLNPNLTDHKFDLVISSGRKTTFPAYLLAKLSNAKIIYVGTPRYRIMKKFHGIISTKTDISKVFKVIVTEMPPTKFKPYLNRAEMSNESLVLLGGDGSGYDYGERDWYRLAFEFKNINTTFMNSRRTPNFAWTNLKENKGKNHKYFDHEDTDFNDLLTALDSHSHIFVTADSSSMIMEIITRGYFVNVVELRGPLKLEHHHEILKSFEEKGLLKVLDMNQLHLSENKFYGNVKEFVVTEREALKSKVLNLL